MELTYRGALLISKKGYLLLLYSLLEKGKDYIY